jgi:hypothetical protein
LLKSLLNLKIALAFCRQIVAMLWLANGKCGANLETTFPVTRKNLKTPRAANRGKSRYKFVRAPE